MDNPERQPGLADRAVAEFSGKSNCAQSICAAFGPALGLPRATALAAACALGAGAAYEGEVCGVVSGAMIMIGLRFGSDLESHPEQKAELMDRAKEFIARFKQEHGSIICRELLGCSIKTPAELQQARDQGLFVSVCRNLVSSGAEILEEIVGPNERA